MRIEAVKRSDVPAEHQHVVDTLEKQFGAIRGPFSVLLHSPALVEQMLAFGNFFRDGGVVDAAHRSIGILTVVREWHCAYVWAAQVNAARRAGLREEAIDVIRGRKDASTLTPEEREIYVYALQMMRERKPDQQAFDALLKRHGARWLAEFTVSTSFFNIHCSLVNAFEVPAPVDGDKLPD